MSMIGDIFATYRSPRRVMARRMEGATEAKALITLMTACVLVFVAQLPQIRQAAYLDPSIPFEARVVGALEALVFFAPLMFYALAGLIWLVVRAAKGAAAGLAIRTSVFWALLAATPLWLVLGLAQGLLGAGAPVTVLGALLLVAIFFFLINAVVYVLKASVPA